MGKIKKMVAFVGALLLLTASIGLGGCVGGGRGDQTTLNIWIQATNQPVYFMGWFKSAFENKHPDIELSFTPSTSLGGELDVSLTASDAPDISATWAHFLRTLSSGNRIVNLDSMLEPYQSEFQEMTHLNKLDNKSYGAPIFGLSSPVIYFNRTLLQSNNLIPSGWQGPANYAELKTLCQSITSITRPGTGNKYKALIHGSGFHVMQSVHARTMPSAQLNAIMQPYSESATNPLSVAGFENGFKSVQKMGSDKVLDGSKTYSTADALDTFRTTEALMVGAISLDLLSLSSATFEIGSFLLPADIPYSSTATDGTAQTADIAGTPDSLTSGVYTDVFVVNQKTTKLDACEKFFEFLYSDAAQEKLLNFFMFPVIKNTGLSGMDEGKRGLYDAALKNVYDEVLEKGISPFYTTYFCKPDLDVAVDSGYKAAVNGSYANVLTTIKAKWAA